MIEPAPFTANGAWTVFQDLDPDDYAEAIMIRGGGPVTPLDLFTDWSLAQRAGFLSHVIYTRAKLKGGRPFAVLCVGHTGQAGVAQAALLARRHDRYTRQLGEAAVQIRRNMPSLCKAYGIYRIEARSWAEHPTAARFLERCGFVLETTMEGFGDGGRDRVQQFAYVSPER